MARAIIEILGDASSAKLAAKETSAVYQTLERDTKQLAVSARTSAQIQVDASLHKTSRLRAEIAAYQEIGAAAKLGSREQIAAAELAARAQARLGKITPQAVISPGGAARINVLESVKQTEALRAEASAYREVAASAQAGSREQVAAAQLAARAERRLASSLGVSASEQRALGRSAARAERDLGRATRGALAGSGVFRGLGRSIAFASGGFLAFASAGQFLRSSIDAAKEAQVTQRQLGQQLKNDGLAFGDYRKQIDDTGLRLSALSGFTKDDLDSALTTILRSTRNVGKALRDEGTAADLARARHISLSQAALILGKTEAGNTTLLRRQGFQILKTATVEQALAAVRAKVAGQARAGSTEQERFGAVLHDTEVIIGAGVLPTLNKYLASGARWLQQMDESGRLQKDVSRISRDFERVIGDIGQAVKIADRISGSFGDTIKDLGGAFLVLGARAKIVKWGLLETEIASVGGSALVAEGRVATLGTRLGALAKLDPITIPIILLTSTKTGRKIANQQGSALRDVFVNDKHFNKKFFSDVGRLLLGGKPKGGLFGKLFGGDGGVNPPPFNGAPKFPFSPFNPALGSAASPKVTPPRRAVSLQGRFNLDELRLANAELTKTNLDNIRILRDEAAITREQIAHTKTLKDRTALTQQLVGIMGQLKSAAKAASDSFTIPDKLSLLTAQASTTASLADDALAARATKAFIQKAIASGKLRGQALIDANNQLGQINSQIASAADQARQDRQKRLQDAITRRSGRQFKALGLDSTGQPLTPGARALRGELGKVSDAITGTFLDTSKERSVLSRIRHVLSGQLGAVTKEVRSQVKQMFDDIDQQLKDHATGNQTKFQVINTKKYLASLGLNLTPAQIRADRARLAQLGAGGTIPGTGPAGAFGAVPSGGGDVVVPVTFQLDGRTVAVNTTRHQIKNRRRNPRQRRGFAGSR